VALTPHLITGFENGRTPEVVTGGPYVAVNGTPIVSAAGAFSGAYGLTLGDASVAGAEEVEFADYPAGKTFGISQFKLRVRQLPTVSLVLAQFYTVSGKNAYLVLTASGDLSLYQWDGSTAVICPNVLTPTLNQWYVICFSVDVSGSSTIARMWTTTTAVAFTLTATQTVPIGGATTLIGFTVGGGSSTTFLVDIDDVNIWYGSLAADVSSPVAEAFVKFYPIGANSSHNLDASTSLFFSKDIAGTITAITNVETTSFQAVDEVPLGSGNDAVRVAKNGSTQPTNTWYLQYAFAQETSFTAAPLAVMAEIVSGLVSAISSNIGSKLFDSVQGTNTEDVTALTGITTVAAKLRSKLFAVRPNAGTAWTVAALNGLRLRWGLTNVADGIPRLEGAGLEVLWPRDPGSGGGGGGGGGGVVAGSTDFWDYDGAGTISDQFTPESTTQHYVLLVDFDPTVQYPTVPAGPYPGGGLQTITATGVSGQPSGQLFNARRYNSDLDEVISVGIFKQGVSGIVVVTAGSLSYDPNTQTASIAVTSSSALYDYALQSEDPASITTWVQGNGATLNLTNPGIGGLTPGDAFRVRLLVRVHGSVQQGTESGYKGDFTYSIPGVTSAAEMWGAVAI
jgi:hypothetical protein